MQIHPAAKTTAGVIVTVVTLPTVLLMVHVAPWITIWSSLLAVLGVLILGHSREHGKWRRDVISIGLMALGSVFFIGGALSYHLAHRAPSVAQTVSRPNLHLAVDGGNIFTAPDAGWTGIGVNARVWNTGSPRIAGGWAMTITPRGGVTVRAQLTKIPASLIATGPFNTATIKASDSLSDKAQAAPIGEIPISGILLFYTVLPKAIVEAPDTVWTIAVKDAYGRESSVNQRVGDWLQR